MTKTEVCYLCRGARVLLRMPCANCGGTGTVLTEVHYCRHCAAPLPPGRTVLCERCVLLTIVKPPL